MMTNYEAIIQMSEEQMEAFLDHVLLTGLNLGMHAASLEEEEQGEVLDTNPYDETWLSSDAEDTTKLVFAEDGDTYLPDALTAVIFKNAGINPDVEN